MGMFSLETDESEEIEEIEEVRRRKRTFRTLSEKWEELGMTREEIWGDMGRIVQNIRVKPEDDTYATAITEPLSRS